MSLTKMCNKGSVFIMDKKSLKIPADIRLIYKRISDSEKEEILKFISEQISDEGIFNLATIFGDQKLNWNDTPLMKLHNISGSEKFAAIALAYLTMECLIQDEQDWGCVKTNITRRDFETNSYFRIPAQNRAA